MGLKLIVRMNKKLSFQPLNIIVPHTRNSDIILLRLSLGNFKFAPFNITMLSRLCAFKNHATAGLTDEALSLPQLLLNYYSMCYCWCLKVEVCSSTVMILSFRTDRPGQTVQTQIRLLLEEQSDQGLHCLLFRLHRLDTLLCGRAIYFKF